MTTAQCGYSTRRVLHNFGCLKRKKIHYLFKYLFNVVITLASTTFSGSLFHKPSTLSMKKLSLRFQVNFSSLTINLCPLVLGSPILGERLHSPYLFPPDLIHLVQVPLPSAATLIPITGRQARRGQSSASLETAAGKT